MRPRLHQCLQRACCLASAFIVMYRFSRMSHAMGDTPQAAYIAACRHFSCSRRLYRAAVSAAADSSSRTVTNEGVKALLVWSHQEKLAGHLVTGRQHSKSFSISHGTASAHKMSTCIADREGKTCMQVAAFYNLISLRHGSA